GDVIPPQFDSMIAKVIAWGRDRSEARARLARALRQTVVVIDGGTTNKAFLLDLLGRREFRTGAVDTTWLDTMMADGYTPPRRFDVALLAVAVEAHDAHVQRQRDRLFTSAERGRPQVGNETWYQVDVRAAGEAYRLRVARSRPDRYRVALDGRAVDVDVERSGRFERRLAVGDRTFSVLSVAQGSDFLVEVEGSVHRISGGEAGLVRAPAPAMVVAVPVKAGDVVAEGDVVAVVESMKLETALRAPVAGQVAEVLVDPNTQVEAGTKLVRMELVPELDGIGEASSGMRADLSALLETAAAERGAAEGLGALRSLVLGYDIDEQEARSLMSGLASDRLDLAADDPGLLAGEIEVLQIFADLCVLSRNRRMPDGMMANEEDSAVDAEATRNPQEYLNAYLRSRDADAEGLPESFRIKLRRALAHYGITDLGPSPDLGPALYRMFLAHRRAGAHVPVVSELLQWRLSHPGSMPDDARDGYLRVLDHLVSATQLRHPMIGDLARQVRYRCFDAPLIAAERARIRQQVRAELDRLSPDPEARAAQIDAMVASGEPLLGVFTERHHAAMLEVMTRRYYRIRSLERVRFTQHDGRPLLTAEYVHDGHHYLVVATVAGGTNADSVTDLHRLVDTLPADRTALIDLYVTSEADGGADPDDRAGLIRDKLGTLPATVGRVAVAVRRTDGDKSGGPTWFTFRGTPGGDRGAAGAPVEDPTLRGLHPMAAERLDLWRLSGFELTRLPSATDVHLFRARGREVPDD
ncbi:MAG: biotin/lipoyl-binding protein, partial [Actinomycetota bacterium]|nr:biotin/lipoyl-binding protein [Actinomycetota bacterium]